MQRFKIRSFFKKINRGYMGYIHSGLQRTTSYIGHHKKLAYAALTYDLIISFFAIPLALFLKIGDEIFDFTQVYLLKISFCFTLCALAYFNLFNSYQAMWRYLETGDIVRHVGAITLAFITFVPLKYLLSQSEILPSLTLLIAWVLCVLMTLSPRILSYIIHHRKREIKGTKPRLLILGTNDGTELFLKAVEQTDNFSYTPHGLISLRTDEVGLNIHGLPIVSSIKGFGQWLEENKGPYHLVIIENPEAEVGEILKLARIHGIPLLKAPKSSLFDQTSLKEISIESLFKTSNIKESPSDLNYFKGKKIFLMGAGHYVFEPFILKLLNCNPKKVILIDHSSSRLNELSRLLNERNVKENLYKLHCVDINDHLLMDHVITSHAPDIMIHSPFMGYSEVADYLSYARTNIASVAFFASMARKLRCKQCVLLLERCYFEETSLHNELLIKRAFMNSIHDSPTQFLIINVENILGSRRSITFHIQSFIKQMKPIVLPNPDTTISLITRDHVGILLLQAIHRLSKKRDILEYTFCSKQKVFLSDIARQILLQTKESIEDEDIIFDPAFNFSVPPHKLGPTSHPHIFYEEYTAWTHIPDIDTFLKACETCDEKRLTALRESYSTASSHKK